MRPTFDQIPEALRKLPRWVTWRYGPRRKNGRQSKIPLNPVTGKPASVANPADWTDCETALAACAKGTHEGVGFVFAPGDGFVGIDLDKCRNPDTGELTPGAARTLEELGTYAEVSPSGTGVKAFALGTIDPSGPKRRGNVEVYGEGRFFTVTGDRVPGTPFDVRRADAQISRLQASLSTGGGSGAVEGGDGFTGADAELVSRALKAKNGPKLAAYMAGEYEEQQTPSEALLGLAQLLAFWTGNDPDRLERIIRGTNLWHRSESERPKWYSRRGDSTWGMKYIVLKAIETCGSFYSGSPPDPESQDTDTHLCKHGARFDLLERMLDRVRAEPIPVQLALEVTSRKHKPQELQRQLAALCLRLSQHTGGEFYLSGECVGKLLGVSQTVVSSWLLKFAKLGLIKRTKWGNGIGGVANCYRWIGPECDQAALVPPTPEPPALVPEVPPKAGNPSVSTTNPEQPRTGSGLSCTNTRGREMEPAPVYYRILLTSERKLAVVPMQWFDEDDYKEHSFLKDDKGEAMRWESKDAARKYLNDHFRVEYIYPDDLTANHPEFRK
jgi:hypothetical protein